MRLKMSRPSESTPNQCFADGGELSEAEIRWFIEKYVQGEIPDYQVGGDNKEFFRKIFIYLGQYRDRMSQPLLMKMYQFSMKI